MTKRELIRAEINLKSRWSQAIYQQQLAKEKPERKEIAEEAANVALGYMYAIADILQVTKGVSNADDKDIAARERAHWNIVYGYAMAAVTVLSLTVEEDEAYVIVSAWRNEATDEYERMG